MITTIPSWAARSAGLFVAAGLLAATFAIAQVPIGQVGPDGVTLKGRVAETFGEKFILEDDSGRILVEMRTAVGQVPALRTGETLVVTGLPKDRVMDARRVARENGEVIFTDTKDAGLAAPLPAHPLPDAAVQRLPSTPIPSASSLRADDISRFLRSLGLTAVGQPERKRKHIEIPARSGAGAEVIVSLDQFGRLWEIEDADHDNKNVPARLTGTAEAERALRQAGYAPRGEIERRKHHFEALATNSRGELVEVHMNLSGHIYKQAWIR
jgi:hypothetical protein